MMTLKMMALLLLAVPLGGCVAGLVASAAGTAIRSAQGEPQSNRHLQPAAQSACTAYAAQYGAVHIIDVVQRSVGKIIVWGTVTDSSERRSFECAFTDKIAGFKLRAIRPAS
jgi:hypothetical protein